MKAPKINGSSIKQFFLFNVEKVILGVSLILLGVFFWLGLGATRFDKSPDDLVSEANQATSYIARDSNWDMIDQYRRGDIDVVTRIEEANQPVDDTQFKSAGLSIIPKALQLRLDPPLPEIESVEAKVIRATVVVASSRSPNDDPILQLPVAKAQIDPDAEEEPNSMDMMGMGMGMGEEEAAMMEEMAAMDEMMMMEMGGMGTGRNKKKKKEKEPEKDPQETAEVDAWSGYPGVQQIVEGGIQPKKNGFSASSAMALNRNIVVVNALINHRKLWKSYEKILSNSVAYYPKRDLPKYDFLQVERRVAGGDEDSWKDVSEFINFEQAELFPGSFVSAPEVVPPGNFDRNLTNAIPPIMGFDYMGYVLHSKISPRVFKKKEKEEEEVSARDRLAGTKKPETGFDNARPGMGRRRAKKSVMGDAGMGMMGMGMGMEDMGMMDMGMEGMGMFGMMNRGDGRSSSDLSEYAKLSDITVEPATDYKAIRFFDMQVSPNKKQTYEYRFRVWMKDPNATDPLALQSGMDDMGMDGMDGMGMDGMGMDGMGMDGMGMPGKKDDAKKIYQKTDINFTMQDQSVRNRLKRAREEKDASGNPVYFVSEIYEPGAEPTEVQVPRGFEYLRFSRPSKWTEPVSVTVEGPEPEYYAAKVQEPRTSRIGDVEIPVEEPTAEIVTSMEAPDLNGATLAAKRRFATGEVINFEEPITVMHPVAMSVHFLNDAKFKTDGTVVDIMGGKRLDLPRNLPVQYSLPGETLLMKSDGSFHISNEIEEKAEARHSLRLPDEKAQFGKRRG